MKDDAAKMSVELYYGVLEDRDLITRAVRVVNQGTGPVRLLRCASLCLDFQQDSMDFITFDGCHTMERCPNRTPLRPGIQSVNSLRGTSSHHHNPFVILCGHEANERLRSLLRRDACLQRQFPGSGGTDPAGE